MYLLVPCLALSIGGGFTMIWAVDPELSDSSNTCIDLSIHDQSGRNRNKNQHKKCRSSRAYLNKIFIYHYLGLPENFYACVSNLH